MLRYNTFPHSGTASCYMKKVVLSGFIIVPDNDLTAVKHALVEHRQLTLSEQGCLCFKVTPHPTDPNRFDVYEEFINQEAFDMHQQRVKRSDWGRISINVERHYQIKTQSEQ